MERGRYPRQPREDDADDLTCEIGPAKVKVMSVTRIYKPVQRFGPLVIVLGCLGCSGSSSTADCNPDLRVDGSVYKLDSMVEVEPDQVFGTAELGSCPEGDGDPNAHEDVEAWSYAGVDPDVLLGVPVGGSWQIFVERSVPENVKKAAVEAISGQR